MNWFECVQDCGDGSNCTLRFKTEESAYEWLKNAYESGYTITGEFDCYPLGELTQVCTESKYFWTDIE